MQSVWSRIWTRVAVSISYADNDYTTGTSNVERVINFVKELKNKNKMKVTVIKIVNKIERRVLETWDLLSLKLQQKTIS